MPLTLISTPPCAALATDKAPTPIRRCPIVWSTCSNLTSECLTSRVRFDKRPLRSFERVVVIDKVVVRAFRCWMIIKNKAKSGIAQTQASGFSRVAPKPITSIDHSRLYPPGLFRKTAGRTLISSCSGVDVDRAGASTMTTVDGAGAAGGGVLCRGRSSSFINSPQCLHFFACGSIGSAQKGQGTAAGSTSVVSATAGGTTARGKGTAGGFGGAGGAMQGIEICPPHPGHLATLPAYLLGALTPLPQLGHSTRIGITSPSSP